MSRITGSKAQTRRGHVHGLHSLVIPLCRLKVGNSCPPPPRTHSESTALAVIVAAACLGRLDPSGISQRLGRQMNIPFLGPA